MKTLAKLLWSIVLATPLLVGLAIWLIRLILEKEETYQWLT